MHQNYIQFFYIQTASLTFTEGQFQPCQFGRLEKPIQMDSQPGTKKTAIPMGRMSTAT